MKRIVLIDECFPLNTRNRRILDSLARHYRQSAQLEVITWDRNNEYIEDMPGYHVYKKTSAYGNRVGLLWLLQGSNPTVGTRCCHCFSLEQSSDGAKAQP